MSWMEPPPCPHSPIAALLHTHTPQVCVGFCFILISSTVPTDVRDGQPAVHPLGRPASSGVFVWRHSLNGKSQVFDGGVCCQGANQKVRQGFSKTPGKGESFQTQCRGGERRRALPSGLGGGVDHPHLAFDPCSGAVVLRVDGECPGSRQSLSHWRGGPGGG